MHHRCRQASRSLQFILELQDWSFPLNTSGQLWPAITGLCVFAQRLETLQDSPSTHEAGDYLQEGDSASQDSTPLHACWSALLQRMLKAGQTALVLRALDTASSSAGSGSAHSVSALLTPHEADLLVDTARSLTHKGK